MNDLNEKLKGWRTIILTWLAVGLSMIEVVRDALISLTSVIDAGMGDAGAVAGIIAVVVTIKQLITDVSKRLKGTLDK